MLSLGLKLKIEIQKLHQNNVPKAWAWPVVCLSAILLSNQIKKSVHCCGFFNMMTTAISSMAVSDCECQTFDWTFLLVAAGIFAWCLAQLLRCCSLLASMCSRSQCQPEGEAAGAVCQTCAPCQTLSSRKGQTKVDKAFHDGPDFDQPIGQTEGQAAAAASQTPGSACQTPGASDLTFDKPKVQSAGAARETPCQTPAPACQMPDCGCQSVRNSDKKVYMTVQGKCYHTDPECQHLRNRHTVVEKVPCSVCVRTCSVCMANN